MKQEKRPNVTARERYVGKYNEATGQFDIVEVDADTREREIEQLADALRSCWYSFPGHHVKPEDPDHAVIRKHWESMGEL